jgi:hypothetical protein
MITLIILLMRQFYVRNQLKEDKAGDEQDSETDEKS